MRREERVTVQGPVKEQQPDGMSHRGLDPPPHPSKAALGVSMGSPAQPTQGPPPPHRGLKMLRTNRV